MARRPRVLSAAWAVAVAASATWLRAHAADVALDAHAYAHVRARTQHVARLGGPGADAVAEGEAGPRLMRRAAAATEAEAAPEATGGGGGRADALEDSLPGGVRDAWEVAQEQAQIEARQPRRGAEPVIFLLRGAKNFTRRAPPADAATSLDDGAESINFHDEYAGNFGGAFSVAFRARFDSRAWNGRVIDFGNGPGEDNIVVARRGTSDDLAFAVHREEMVGGEVRRTNRSVVALGVIPVGNSSAFLCAVDALGHMRILREGKTIAERKDGFSPEQVPRINLFVGRSNWEGDGLFQGQISNLRVWNSVVSWSSVDASDRLA